MHPVWHGSNNTAFVHQMGPTVLLSTSNFPLHGLNAFQSSYMCLQSVLLACSSLMDIYSPATGCRCTLQLALFLCEISCEILPYFSHLCLMVDPDLSHQRQYLYELLKSHVIDDCVTGPASVSLCKKKKKKGCCTGFTLDGLYLVNNCWASD